MAILKTARKMELQDTASQYEDVAPFVPAYNLTQGKVRLTKGQIVAIGCALYASVPCVDSKMSLWLSRSRLDALR